MFVARILFLITMLVVEVHHWHFWLTVKKKIPGIWYLTELAFHMTLVHFVLLFTAHMIARFGKEDNGGKPNDSASIMHLWKWCSCLAFLVLLIQFFVTVVYWVMIHHTLDEPGTFMQEYTHWLPLALLSLDWLLNRIYCEFNQITIALSFFVFYMLLNLIITKATGKPVYKAYSWDSTAAWINGLILFPISAIVYVCYWGLTLLKFKLLSTISSLQDQEQRISSSGLTSI